MEQPHQLHTGQQHSPSVPNRPRLLHGIGGSEHTLGFVAIRKGPDIPNRGQGGVHGLGTNRNGIVGGSGGRRGQPNMVGTLRVGNHWNGLGNACRRRYNTLFGSPDHRRCGGSHAEWDGATGNRSRCCCGPCWQNDASLGVGIQHGVGTPSSVFVCAFQGIVYGSEHRGGRLEHAERRERKILRAFGFDGRRPGVGWTHASTKSCRASVCSSRTSSGHRHTGKGLSSQSIVSRTIQNTH
mmetsp:Transcript_11552/g.29258  ORF Transcript_11552/g.29258 Transcript_11552/m.29258 type:complete len:239 (+) Transcript_11552:1305-2021(+)